MRKQPTPVQRYGILATVVFLVALVGSMAIVFSSVGHTTPCTASIGTHHATATAHAANTAHPTHWAFHPGKSLGNLVAVTGVGQGVQVSNASTRVLWKTYPDNSQASTVSIA